MKELWKNPQTKREKGLVCFCMFLLVILIALIAAFCFIQTKKEDSTFIPDIEDESTVCDTQVCEEAARSIGEALDPSVNPCVDFYQYVCGRWIERHPVPDDKSTYTVDHVLEDELAENLSELLSGERASPAARTPKAVKDAAIIFRGCMNEEARENQGLEPLKRVLQTYEGWPMIDVDWDGSDYQWYVELAKMMRDLQRSGIIAVYVSPDAKNTSRNLIHIDQAGFGLGRNQLINPNSSKRNEELVSAYREYMVSSAKILDATRDELQLNRDARDIVEFESSLAKFSRSPEEQIDVTSTYNKMTLREMQIITKNRIFLWKDFLNILFEGHAVVTDNTEVVLGELNYVTNALKLLYESKKRTIANYIGFRVVSKYGPHTTLRFRENKHNFTKIKNGIQKMPLLRLSCMGIVETLLGYAVGRLYIDQYFMEEAKRDVRNMVENVKTVYHATLKNSAWLDDATKLNILDKLEAMNNSIAYPEWIKEDEVLNAYYHTEEELKEGEYFSSLIVLSKAMSQKDLEIINKPVSTVTKYFTPATVNAFYNIRGNAIEFPAGILNVPYYEYNRPLSLNFGGIGSIIGHEISHGFDNQGHQYDKNGNIADLWSEKSRQEYEEKVRCFKDQYSNCMEPLTQMQLNGNSSAGENMADNAGIKSSYFAYKLKRMLSSDNKIQNDKLPGIAASPDQLFFIGYALAWCGSERKETLESTIQYDQHSPIRYRVNIPLSNFQEFAKSFNCPIGSPMNPEEKCTLW